MHICTNVALTCRKNAYFDNLFILSLYYFTHRPQNSYVDLRTQSLDLEPEEETISVDDDDSEDEGPHSWPGRNTTHSSPPVVSESFLKSITRPQYPVIHPIANRATLQPLMLKPSTMSPQGITMPTLFTIVPSGLVQRTPTSIKTAFMQQASPITTMSPVSNRGTPREVIMPTVPTVIESPQQFHCTTASTATSSSVLMKPLQQLNKCATTLAAIPPEEMTPAYYELKDFAESFKTKRIQLGYTQGAVGQSLSDRGYSNFAQSTISRFEQMQLSPSNAAAIKVVLERWLLDADNPEAVTSTTLDPLGPPRKRKKRAVFSTNTRETLEDYFHKEARPNRQIVETIADELTLLPEEVRVWFCNKRQKLKMMDDCSIEEDCSASIKSMPSSPTNSRSSTPPRTKFTIEELSKSSNSTGYTFSPVCFTSAFTVSPQRLQPIMMSSGNTVAVSSSPYNHLVTKA